MVLCSCLSRLPSSENDGAITLACSARAVELDCNPATLQVLRRGVPGQRQQGCSPAGHLQQVGGSGGCSLLPACIWVCCQTCVADVPWMQCNAGRSGEGHACVERHSFQPKRCSANSSTACRAGSQQMPPSDPHHQCVLPRFAAGSRTTQRATAQAASQVGGRLLPGPLPRRACRLPLQLTWAAAGP